jgi:hypothetical protein
MAENAGAPYDSLSDEVLSLFETNASAWNDAAQRCEEIAGAAIDDRAKREWLLLAAVYRERVSLHTVLLSKLRPGPDGSAR